MSLKTFIRRPQDCSSALRHAFAEVVISGEEMDERQVLLGMPYAEVLLFTVEGQTVIGACALRYPKLSFLRHLFEKAGKPEMCNPHSIEECWLSVHPDHRGKGVWAHNRQAKVSYLGNRPYHSVMRADNLNVVNPDKEEKYVTVGTDFHSHISDHKLRLMVVNHDPVFDPEKRLVYL